ncbi:MAG: hypothetical protein BWX71_02317 [Deltaproteobacteria bacterium ADurb.Bin072]|nr:MAG: hypothetical protein BWX71_02317 [Deltaproteobacteria bacterium ADurb.Bin072]
MLAASVGFGFLCEAIGYGAAFRVVGVVGVCLLTGLGFRAKASG